VRPATIEQAAIAMATNPTLRPVAGGTDLLLDLARDGLGRSIDLLDMTGVHGLAELRTTAVGAVIGAGVTHADVIAHPDFGTDGLSVLRQACLEVGSPQLRNRATIAGNLVTASPANDTISALLALDAEVRTIKAVDGEMVWRSIKLEDFYDGFRSTVLEPTELVALVSIPASVGERRGIWVKAGLRKAQAISVVHAGLVLQFDDDGAVATARVALGSVGPTVALSEPAAQALVGSRLESQVITAAADAAADSVEPIDDGRATADYRTSSVRTVVSRALQALAAGQENSMWPENAPLLSTRLAASRFSSERGQARPAIEPGAEISVTVNGTTLAAAPTGASTLLDWLRDVAGTGTKEGCAEGECGACTAVMNGDAVMTCLVPASQADGAEVTTVEGTGSANAPSVMQQAFVDKFAVQCGYCIPGFIMTAQTLADELGTVPTRDQIELALSGNLCRCTGYYNIIDAVTAAIQGEPS
jgi:carbon-monoxide dehydrogenase medium subunit